MLKKLILTTALLALSACGYHFQNEQLLPQEVRTLQLESNDPYSDMARAMRSQLQLRNVVLVEGRKDVAVLRLNRISFEDEVASVFKQGREAEKILMLTVDATIKLPNQPARPISAKVNRTFFDNFRAALAKSAERDMLRKDMYEQAARQLIIKMAAVKSN